MTQPLSFDPRALLNALAVQANEQARDPNVREILHEAHDSLEEMIHHCERLTDERNVAVREASHWCNRFVETTRKLEKISEQEKGPDPNELGRSNTAPRSRNQ